ncbi:enoyl-CoA hydratase/isomerase family protein [Ectothiorhodospiraceae bacterium WFHF3C12]|nr:enoyl-CoA hydratase/isomerase family protein [Ectothiorhodospiraceae bacterium WFHF3C12]
MSGLVKLEVEPPVALVSLNRPERHNSLIPELVEGLTDTMQALAQRNDVRAVVLRGEGRSFSTGGDLQGFLQHWDDDISGYADRVVGGLNRAILAIKDCPLPVVAAVHGWVTGGSLGLMLAADMVVIDDTARLAPFYCEVGFAPDGGWSALLPGRIGEGRALAAQMTNEIWDAEALMTLGLAQWRVGRGEVDDAARRHAQTVAGKAASTLGATKANRSQLGGWAEALDVERRRFVETIVQPGVREGVEAFVAGAVG